MKYFEFSEPYYALIKANDEKTALKKYDDLIADKNNVSVQEVSKDYAYGRFFNALVGIRPSIRIKELKDLFIKNDILLVDGNL